MKTHGSSNSSLNKNDFIEVAYQLGYPQYIIEKLKATDDKDTVRMEHIMTEGRLLNR